MHTDLGDSQPSTIDVVMGLTSTVAPVSRPSQTESETCNPEIETGLEGRGRTVEE
jgi:hypothetical protein